MRIAAGLMMLASLIFGACSPTSHGEGGAGKMSAVTPCPDDGPRLSETGVCVGRAMAYLDDSKGAPEETPPPGCAWTINETILPGDEALIYRAATCKGVTTKLGYAGGAHSASISYETSALSDGLKGHEVIKLFGTEPDPQGALKEAIAALPDRERKDCEIQPAGFDFWPSDALVIGLTKTARAKLPKDEPIAMCGPFGRDEDSVRYWRIKQGFAWFFDLGQEQLDFDPTTISVIAKTPDGSWAAKP